MSSDGEGRRLVGGDAEPHLDARHLIDAAPDAMVVVDGSGRIVLVNVQAEALFGHSRVELVGADLDLLIPEAARARHAEHVDNYVGRPTTRAMGQDLELRARHRDGHEIPVEVSLSPVRTEAGLVVCAAVRDVTERKRIEAQARLSNERLASAVESIEDALALYDADDRLLLCNSAYRTVVAGLLPGPIVGCRYEAILDAWLPTLAFDGDAERDAFRADCGVRRRAQRAAVDVRTREDRRLRVTTRRTAEGGSVETIWDLTADLRQAEELSQARAAAEAASSAKSDFLSAMSHELRTPMNAILGFAQLLYRDRKAPLSDRHRERIEHILKGGQHLLQLIEEILDLSRIESGRVPISLELVDVAEVMADVRDTLVPMAGRHGVKFLMEPVPADFPPVMADRVRFRQVLMNFGTNAIKYGRAGGHAVLAAELSGNVVRVGVRDDGAGIPEDKQARIFEPFFRAGQESGAIEGTGIGLAISQRLATLMDGQLGFRSQVGVGSEFWLQLSAYLESKSTPPAARSQGAIGPRLSGADGKRHLVLYVEDNPSNIAFMQDLVEDFDGVELITAPNAEIGIELARARQPKVVIMDINLPGMSGLEATRRLAQTQETRAIPVIALSAAATARDAARAAEVGFYRYLTKPVEVDKLAAALEELLLD